MTQKRVRLIIFALISLLWVAVIFSFSLQPASESGDLSMSLTKKIVLFFFPGMSEGRLDFWDHIVRKAAHFTEYFILGVFVSAAFLQTDVKHNKLIAFVCAAAVSCADETLQVFTEGRAGRFTDVLLDCFGVLAGIFALAFSITVVKRCRAAGKE